MRDTKPKREWGDEKFVTQGYGITRTPLYALRKKGLIRSVSIKPEGATYGKRLFNIASIEAYLADCERRELAATEGVAGAARKAKKARRRSATKQEGIATP